MKNIIWVCTALADSLDATLVNMRFVKPLDEELLVRLATRHEAFVTVEENVIAGGAGSAVIELFEARGISVPTLQIGLPDHFIEHGSRADNLAEAGLDTAGITRTINRWWQPAAKRRRPEAG